MGILGQISEINNHLFLSGADVLKLEKLRQRKVTCVINATIELKSIHAPGIDYLKISIADNPMARIDQYFDLVADKIRATKDRGGRTLLHCAAGVSRSATLCIVYLLKYEAMSLRQAYHYVKSARPIIRPNIGFWRQMIDYEYKIRGVNSVSMVDTQCDDIVVPDVYYNEMKSLMHGSRNSHVRNISIAHIPYKLSTFSSLRQNHQQPPSSSSSMLYSSSSSSSRRPSLFKFGTKNASPLANTSTLSRRQEFLPSSLRDDLFFSRFSTI